MSSYGDFIALSDPCDKETAAIIAKEVSDGVIAPAYDEEALTILKRKQKGAYTILEIDATYTPEELECKTVFGICFEQERNNIQLERSLLDHVLTQRKDIPEDSVVDLLISLIILKYTQSNSVCYVKDGQAIGIGAGQQSRLHCTRLAGDKADHWFLRQHPKVLELPFLPGLGRPQRDNATDLYISAHPEDILSDGLWQQSFTRKPDVLSDTEKKQWLSAFTGVALGSDAFFPFEDNIQRAAASGVSYIAQPGGSIRDKEVIECCDRYGIYMAMTGVRLFHH